MLHLSFFQFHIGPTLGLAFYFRMNSLKRRRECDITITLPFIMIYIDFELILKKQPDKIQWLEFFNHF